MRFYLGRFGNTGAAPYPTVVTIPAPPPQGGQQTVTFGVTVQWPNLTVRDLRGLETAGQVLRSGGATVELLLEETGEMLSSMKTKSSSELFHMGVWNADLIRGLRGVDGDLPAPLFVPVEQLAECGRMSAADRSRWWLSRRETGQTSRAESCALFLRIVTPAGMAIEERFLKFLSRNPFGVPSIGPGGTFTQDELDRRWNGGEEEFLITAYFEPDVYEMARLLREWCRNPRSDFPFKFHFGPASVPSPLARTGLSVVFPRALDRVWHRERQVIFELRPVSRGEAYELEATYWRNSGHPGRAELAEEIRARIGTIAVPM